ncbi:MAG: hypothetical protein QXM68_02995 [Candidatus Aenigmatarchaeota archaeon]|nr:hypothetical protein [Candidatus Aenigmarchaeota archaeon]
MGMGSFLDKITNTAKKFTEKIQTDVKRREEIKILKEKYLSRLSQKELITLYKMYFSD